MARGVIVTGSLNLDMVVVTPRTPGPGENICGSGFQMVACAAGAGAVMVKGAMPSMPDRKKVEELVAGREENWKRL